VQTFRFASADQEKNMPLSHFDADGASRMVNVGAKEPTHRVARASASVRMKPETLELIQNRQMAKGDVFEVARLAGIMAAKRTDELIPLCHGLPLESVEIGFECTERHTVTIHSQAETVAKTGVEMEALTAVATAALTLYDMCKSVDREMVIERIQLEEKKGGKSGHFIRTAAGES
jgi:cyclic pyranopterin phosphate synthase